MPDCRETTVDTLIFGVVTDRLHSAGGAWALADGDRARLSPKSAQCCSLVANSVKSEIVVEPTLEIVA